MKYSDLRKVLLEHSSNTNRLTSFLKNNSDVVADISDIFNLNIINVKNVNLSEFDIKQKIWHFLNDDWNVQMCEACNHNMKRWYGLKAGWLGTCELSDCGTHLNEFALIELLKHKVELQIKLQQFFKKRPIVLEKIDTLFYSKIDNDKVELKLDQKIWHIINNNWQIQLCPICNKLKSWIAIGEGWRNTCSKETCRIAQIGNTKLERYGDINYNNRDKAEETTLDRYGVKNVALVDSIKEKRKNTTIERYGVEHTSSAESVKKKMSISNKEFAKNNPEAIKTRVQNYININNKELIERCKEKDVKLITIQSYTLNCKCDNCNNFFNISRQMFNIRYRNNEVICNICNQYRKSNTYSKAHEELTLYIQENYLNTIKINTRSLISPKEIDIHVLDLNIALEYNGLYWHSELYRDEKYHLEKTEKCLEQGIKLIHIWEDDWNFKQEIVKSRLLNLINKTPNKIFARKCKIKEITAKESRVFLDENHLQGYVASLVKIGLFYNDVLVSLMTFGKLRKALNQSGSVDSYEMYRFCSKLNTNIVGGASKLFKYFVRTYNPVSIITYFDRSWGQSSVYKQLGFNFLNNTGVNYWYIIDGMRSHRFNWTKHKLVEQGYDKNMTEVEIMNSLGHYRLFGPGNEKWMWTNN